MPLPQLNTTIDYSNALYKFAEGERQRQEQADISANRNLQTQSLVENRQVENAFRQMQMNREQAVLENTKLDTVHKMLATADPANEEDWKAFATFSEQHGSKIPVPVKADGAFDSEVATKWRDNKLDAIAYMRTGNKDIDQINLIKENPDGTAETLVHYAKKKDKTSFDPLKEYGKGWKVVDKFANPQELDEKRRELNRKESAEGNKGTRVEIEVTEGDETSIDSVRVPNNVVSAQAYLDSIYGKGKVRIRTQGERTEKPIAEEKEFGAINKIEEIIADDPTDQEKVASVTGSVSFLLKEAPVSSTSAYVIAPYKNWRNKELNKLVKVDFGINPNTNKPITMATINALAKKTGKSKAKIIQELYAEQQKSEE